MWPASGAGSRPRRAPPPSSRGPPGYAIEVGPHKLDSLQFGELLNQARATLPLDPARALEILDDALGLWRGAAFAEFADEDIAGAEAARLEEAPADGGGASRRSVAGTGPQR
jgi:transcriptional activator